nr:MAG TPA: hypothetical protein [Bacteriophage sp.]
MYNKASLLFFWFARKLIYIYIYFLAIKAKEVHHELYQDFRN